MQRIDLSGKRFGRWLVTSEHEYSISHHSMMWKCICDCGVEKIVSGNRLRSGQTRSCGCFLKDWKSTERKTHGKSGSAEYRSWRNMKTRCYNPKATRYKNYGGRGITICDRWKNDFSAFYEDMGPLPSPKHTIERIDVDGNYCPENCVWLELKFQNLNKTNSKHRQELR